MLVSVEAAAQRRVLGCAPCKRIDRSPDAPHAPSRRRFLTTTALAGVAVALAAMPLAARADDHTYTNGEDNAAAIAMNAQDAKLTVGSGITATQSGALTVVGPIPDGQLRQLVVTGGGSLTLTNTANSWPNTTWVEYGTTLQGTTQTISGSLIELAPAAKLNLVQSASGTFAPGIDGAGLVNVSGLDSGAAVTFTSASLTNAGIIGGADGHIAIGSTGNYQRLGDNNLIWLQGVGSSLNNAGTITSTVNTDGSGTAPVRAEAAGGATITNSGTISRVAASGTTLGGGYVIDALNGALNLTNTSTGKIWNKIAGGGVSGTSGLTIDNSGQIIAVDRAVSIAKDSDAVTALGVITNRSAGLIQSTGGTGVYMNAGGSVDNAGQITAAAEAVFIDNSGSVTNRAGGEISSSGADAVRLYVGGSVTNAATGEITATGTGKIAVHVGGTTSAVDNSGAIAGDGAGVFFDHTADLTNRAGGSITSASGYSVFGESGSIGNAGLIHSDNTTTIQLNTGAVTNLSTGAITSDSVENVTLNLSGDGSVENTGQITGVWGAIRSGGATTITNHAGGEISAENSTALYLESSTGVTSVTNAAGATIESTGDGAAAIQAFSSHMTVDNAGTISGGDTGVQLNFGGTVTNRAGATISGGNSFGVLFQASGTGKIDNAGTISGGYAGVYAYDGVPIKLTSSGEIDGGDHAIWGDVGDDSISLKAGSVTNGVVGGWDGDDAITVAAGATVNGAIQGEGDNDTLRIAGTVNAAVDGGDGDDVITVAAGSTVTGSIYGGGGDDTIRVTGGTLGGNVDGGDGDDTMTIGAVTVHGDVRGRIGNDNITVAAGANIVGGAIGGDEGDDNITLLGAVTTTFGIFGNTGSDTLTLDGAGAASIDFNDFAEFETLTKAGSGTWTLTGDDSTSGITTINAGSGAAAGKLVFDGTTGVAGAINVDGAVLRAATAGAFGTATIHAIDPRIEFGATGTYANPISLEVIHGFADPTTLAADAGVTATLSGAITRGAGDARQLVTFDGAGTIVLTNTGNAWAGVTTVNGDATLQGTSATISGDSIVDNGALVFTQDAAGSMSQAISGSGSFTKTGSAGLTLAGAASWTGATTVSSGALIGTAASLGGSSITNNATLIYDQASNATVDKAISGSGVLLKSGAGVLTLTAPHLATGTTAVSGGTLDVVGSQWANGGDISVGAGGDGVLDISDGAEVTSVYGTIAPSDGPRGGILLTGHGTSFIASDEFSVGYRGEGYLTVEAGAALRSLDGVVGQLGLAYGDALVTGANSTWTMTDGLIVGDKNYAEGYLAIEDGGVVTSAGGVIGAGTHTQGHVSVSGADSLWRVGAGGLTVGDSGEGDLAISDGGAVSINAGAGKLIIGQNGDGLLTIGGFDCGCGGLLAPGVLNAVGVQAGAGLAQIVFEHTSADYHFAPWLEGDLQVSILAGTTRLTGDSSAAGTGGAGFTGTAVVGDPFGEGPAHLIVDGVLGGDPNTALLDSHGAIVTPGDGMVVVTEGGIVSGSGEIRGVLAVGTPFVGLNDTGTLRGVSGQVLTIGKLSLGQDAIIDATLGSISDPALFDVRGGLFLDGTLDISSIGTLDVGVHRLMTYGGALTDRGLLIGATPAGLDAGDLQIVVGGGEVDLLNRTGQSSRFWDGGDTALHYNNAVDGGDGAWNLANANWANESGQVNGAFDTTSGFAAFGGMAGTVSVDDGGGAVTASGLRFTTDGYVIGGDKLTLANQALVRVDAGESATISAVLAGTDGLTKDDGGALILGGSNTYTGGTTLLAGVLQVGADANLGDASGGLVFDGGTLRNSAAMNSARGVTLGAGGGTIDTAANLTLGGAITGEGSLTKIGAGILTLSGSNDHTGDTLLQAGAIKADAADAFSASSNLVLSAGTTVDLANLAQAVGGLNGEGQVLLGSAALTVGGAGANTYGGVIEGTGGLVKTGAGSLILTGTSTYLGQTVVDQGALKVSGSIATSSGVSVNTGGVLSGSGVVAATTVNGGEISPGDLIGTLTVAGAMTFNPGSIFNVDISSTGADLLDVQGSAILGGVLNAVGLGSGFSRNDSYTLLTADDGLSGSFGGFTYSGFGDLRPRLIYDLHNVYLTLSSTAVDNSQPFFDPTDPSATDPDLLEFDGGTLKTGGYNFAQPVLLDAAGGVVDTDGQTSAFTGLVSGPGRLTIGGGGQFFLTQANDFTGGVLVDDDTTLTIQTDANLGAPSGDLVLDDGTVNFQQDTSSTRGLDILAGGGTLNTSGQVTWWGAVAGAGDLTKTGEGTLTLANANPGFSGDIFFQGTLQAGATGAFGTGAVHVIGSTLLLNDGVTIANPVDLQDGLYLAQNGGAATLSGNISQSNGVWGLTKTGAGTATLSGANTFTGPTDVAQGTLVLSGGQAISDASDVTMQTGAFLDLASSERIGSLSGDGAVMLGANTLTTGADGGSTTYAGQMSGAGGLVKTGAGSFTLEGANSYTGPTVVGGGALALGGGQAVSDVSDVSVLAGATLVLNSSETVGSLSGEGLLNLGSSTLTTGAGGASTAFGGTSSGTGGLTKVGGGTFTLAGANSYTGATLVGGGALALSGGQAISDASDVDVLAGAALNLNSSETIGSLSGEGLLSLGSNTLATGADGASTAFSGTSAGTGGVTKVGGGIFYLSGAQGYTGATTVAAGGLTVLGSVAGSAQVNGGALVLLGSVGGTTTVNGGALSGVGSTAQLVLQSGVISPGTASGAFGQISTGALTVSGGTLTTDFGGANTANRSDILAASGPVTLNGGTVDAHPTSSAAQYGFDQRYQIVSGQVTGSFANPTAFTVNAYSPYLLQRVRYDLGGAVLEIRKLLDFSAPAATANQAAVGEGLNGTEAAADDAWADVLNRLSLVPASSQASTLDRLSGEGIADAAQTTEEGLERFLALVQSPTGAAGGVSPALASLSDSNPRSPYLTLASAAGTAALLSAAEPPARGAWARGFGARSAVDGDQGHADVRSDVRGLAIGADAPLGRHVQLGVAGGAADLDTDVAARQTTANAQAYYLAAYARLADSRWLGAVTGAWGRTGVDTSRTVGLTGATAAGDTHASTFGASALLGYRLALPDGGELQPQVSGAWVHSRQGGFTETGAGPLGLTVGTATTERYTGTVGARWLRAFDTADGATITPELRGGLAMAGGDRAGLIDAGFSGAPTGTGGFQVQGTSVPRRWAQVGGGLTVTSRDDRLAITFGYDGAFAGRLVEHQIAGGLRLAW